MSRLCDFRLLPLIALLVVLPASSQNQPAADPTTANAPADASADLTPLTPEENGDILEVRGRYQAAIESYAKEQQPSAEVWNKMGIAYQMLYDLKDAARCYKHALQLAPTNPNVLNNLGTVEDLLGDLPAAEHFYRKSLNLQADSAVTMKNLGTNLLSQHQYGRGAEAYKRALALDPHVFDPYEGPGVDVPAPASERGTINYFAAETCAGAGLKDCALNFLRKAINEGAATIKRVSADNAFQDLRGNPDLEKLLAETHEAK